jgi:hypothetical protein
MQTFRTFTTAQEARDYRHEHGTGGWILVPERDAPVVLFPPDMTPTAILRHPFSRGVTGELIGHTAGRRRVGGRQCGLTH